MLINIINELKNLEGKEVGKGTYFHKIYTNELDRNTIKTIDILENLLQYEVSNQFEIINYLDEYEEEILQVSFEEYCSIEEYELINSDNSYNWLAPISNHINYNIYKSELYEGVIVELKVHKYGDVRYNYTNECYLSFNDEHEFYEALAESDLYYEVEKNKEKYFINISIFNDCPFIEIENGDYIEGYEAIELLEKLLNK